MLEEIGEGLPVSNPEQGAKEDFVIPQTDKTELPNRREIKPISGGAPWIVERPDEIKNDKLKRIARSLEMTPDALKTDERLERAFSSIEELYIQGVDEAEPILAAINEKLEASAKRKVEEEPQIERLKSPESAEEAVGIFLAEIFSLHERGLREGKTWEEPGESLSGYWTLQRWVDHFPEEIKGMSDEKLSESLKTEYPDGVFLKEKFGLLLEAMKRLHSREIEITRAEGGLDDLGVSKSGESAAPILKVPLTNIRPVDWYILTHVGELFPESTKPETKIDVQSAWDLWRGIGEQPFGFFEKNNKNEWELRDNVPKDQQERLIREKKAKWDLKKIKIKEYEYSYTLEELFKSYRVMADVRTKIIENMGGNRVANIRAESLAHTISIVALTLDMWDRRRWKEKGRNDARDLMWFDWKRMGRLLQARPSGPTDTVGGYWFFEDQGEREFPSVYAARLGKREADMRLKILEKNRERAVFLVKRSDRSEGTLIGDFFHSNTFKGDNGKDQRLADVPLTEIPWLDPGKFEEVVYSGYFTYSMSIADQIHRQIENLSWKPEDLKNRDFWVRLTDLTHRLPEFSPCLVTRGSSGDFVLLFRRTLARGIFWTGSYLAQPNPENPLAVGIFSREDVYGDSLFGIKLGPGILDAIKASGYLDEQNYKTLGREVDEFNFHLKGGKVRR